MYKKTPDWVQCETCSEKATKSCLNCGTTYCETHLKPHMVAKRLKKHKLMDPVENLEDYICKKHERPLQFFCRDDQTCVCQFCTEGDHRGHNTVPVEEEYEEKKSQLKKTQREVQEIIQDREKMHKKFKATHALRETQKNQLKADIEDKFCLEKILPRLLEGMEEEQRAAERQAEGLIKDLQQEITEHQRRNSELEKISHTEDHLHLLQIYPTLCSPPHTRNWADVMGPHLSEEAVRRTASENEILFYKKLKTFLETLSKKAQIIAEIKQCGLHAVDVTLDPDSAHPSLILSADGKQLRYTMSELGDCQNEATAPEKLHAQCQKEVFAVGERSGEGHYPTSSLKSEVIVTCDNHLNQETDSTRGQISKSVSVSEPHQTSGHVGSGERSIQHERPESPVPSVLSMTSDSDSMGRGIAFNKDSFISTKDQLERPDSPSSTSLWSDQPENPVISPSENQSCHDASVPGLVPCCICPVKAVKSCLTCCASYCHLHVRQHYTAPALQKHRLVEVAGDVVEQKFCQQHHRELELYCTTDHTYICALCAVMEHSGHKILFNQPEDQVQIQVFF
uniref:B box-type domain-containing protein n=1 Tax=Denticeps clupeoides TaxID=299321 RepID=A0AAY4A5I8_9TELE